MPYTGGDLNILNGKMGISAPENSVPVMQLIRQHKPKSKDALVQLIEYHKNNKCPCGIVSKGTVRDFGESLYNAQKEYWGTPRFTLQECIQWEYDLFVIQSLKGNIMENKALKLLQESIPKLQFTEALGYLDDTLRIDIVIYKNNNSVGGIQVKPDTFKHTRSEVQLMQKKQNEKWNNPVWMLYYNKEERFSNLKTTIENIINSIIR